MTFSLVMHFKYNTNSMIHQKKKKKKPVVDFIKIWNFSVKDIKRMKKTKKETAD